ncbi:MAG TPA: FG-GAP-like repeat-containing protein [Candidatus Binatia bacterium]|nr:FG-GAP-like repeat-containing protein [Candidatus Binatia bacterium]
MIATRAFGSLRALGLFLLILALPLAHAAAQYMYLDTNGDGIHTAADVVAGGTTSVDVWLRTNVNRDSSPASCVTSDGDLTINSYEFILRTSNGTVSWGAIENRIAAFSIPYGIESSGSDYHAGYVSGTILPPGDYRLATVPITVSGGTPSIEIASSTPIRATYGTSFGAQCFGIDFDNTMKLGQEWNDTDGLAWGGTANRAPTLEQPSDMSVVEGATADQTLSATDPDGDAITFSGSPLGFMTVTTASAGTGSASGTIRLAPGASDGGNYLAEVWATDGFATDRKTFHITVIEGLSIDVGPVANMTVDSYGFATQAVTARDLDNRPLTFAKASGPDFVSVIDRGVGAAEIRLDPGLYNAGVYQASVVVRDGVSPDVTRAFQITVAPPPPCGPGYCFLERNWMTPGEFSFETHLADVNGDSRLDLVTAVYHRVLVRLGLGNGAFAPPIESTYQGYDLIDLYLSTAADVNGDGRADLLLPVRDNNDTQQSLLPLYGQPNGSMIVGPPITTVDTRGKPVVGDLNRDGMPDIVIGLENCGLGCFQHQLLIFFGAPGGTFSEPAVLTLPDFIHQVDLADMNTDGSLDLVIAHGDFIEAYSVFLNRGDGTFDAGHSTQSSYGYQSRDLVVGDWNGDGLPDLISSIGWGPPGASEVLLGQGNGLFTKAALARTGVFGERLSAADFNGDGKTDLIVAGWTSGLPPSLGVTLLVGKGDGTFQGRVDLPAGQGATNADVGDLNGDGMADLALNDTRTLRVLLSRGWAPQPNRPPYFSGLDGEYHADNRTQPYFYISARLDDPDNDPFQGFSVDQSSLPWSLISFSSVIPGWFEGFGYVYPVIPPGTYPITLTGTMGGQTVTRTVKLVITGVAPEVYSFEAVQDANSRSLALAGTAPRSYCFGIEPVGGRFRAWDVAIDRIVMKSDLGTVSSIHALTNKGTVVVDRDNDGIQEIEACFSGADLAKLFSTVSGRRQVTATVEAYTYDLHKITGTIMLNVVGGADGAQTAAFVSPNPLNPEGVLVFGMPSDGPARVELFDIRGRRVRTLVNEAFVAEGRHEVRIDGTNGRGQPLASGVYYYRVTTPGGTNNGRFAILK